MTVALKDVVADFRQTLAALEMPSFQSKADAAKEAGADLVHALADFEQHLPRILRSKPNAVKEALADLRRTIAEFSVPSTRLEVKRSSSGTEIQGYASVFNTLDSDLEIVDKGAFTASLAEHRSAGTRPLMLWQHNPAEPIGVWENLSEDSKGLLAQGRLLPDVQRASEALALIKAGAIYGLSIGFRTVRDQVVNKIRHLQQVNLLEVSLVSFASNPDARLVAGKEYVFREDKDGDFRKEMSSVADMRRVIADLTRLW